MQGSPDWLLVEQVSFPLFFSSCWCLLLLSWACCWHWPGHPPTLPRYLPASRSSSLLHLSYYLLRWMLLVCLEVFCFWGMDHLPIQSKQHILWGLLQLVWVWTERFSVNELDKGQNKAADNEKLGGVKKTKGEMCNPCIYSFSICLTVFLSYVFSKNPIKSQNTYILILIWKELDFNFTEGKIITEVKTPATPVVCGKTLLLDHSSLLPLSGHQKTHYKQHLSRVDIKSHQS